MSKPVVIGATIEFNFLGLRKGHAEFYKYIERCAKRGEPISAEESAKIYYNFMRDPNAFWLGKNHPIRYHVLQKTGQHKKDDLLTVKNKDAFHFFSTNHKYKHHFNAWCMRPVRDWIKGVIGSLVMRGLLQVIPKLDTNLLEK